MKVILLTGSHPRHLFIAKSLYKSGFLQGLLLEQREDFTPAPPDGLNESDRRNFLRHFRDRDEAEYRMFGEQHDIAAFHGVPVHETSSEQLNSLPVRNWIVGQRADIVLSYGIHKLSDDLLEVMPEQAWNIHGGLSPWYRGAITLFWPFYFLQPNWAGMTIHKLSSRLDAGDILHHSVPELMRGDGIHDVACRAVWQVAQDLLKILDKVKGGEAVKAVPQKSSGKLFLARDWTPQHLRLIYDTFDNDIVDRFLDGDLGYQEPPLVRAF
ncbi:formyltransferase family protein [Ammoniphilus sp. CFH 90114]|uniref:formyltransferase family protein n=1 Tax=Ammoniphilus sp. CFH 90114 TaxID=2493665 RepID=UPI00100F52E1|nr:formyltransferase family protein [Ammoniphilus sp. CFH 90114]RXT04460.1 methionyl-tRNA formyltransferase [Ammoniphilus sp. CFH 90114]